MLIDTHTHAVADESERYPRREVELPNGAWFDDDDCSVESLANAVEASPVDGFVLVQAAGAYGDDNRYLLDAVTAHRDITTGVAIIDPLRGDVVARVAALGANPAVTGLRLFHIPSPNPPWLASPVGDRLVDAAASVDLTVSVCCLASDLPALAQQAARRPDVTFVLDHCGFADFSGPTPFAAAAPLWTLADRSNVTVKLTPTAMMVGEASDPAAVVEQLIGRFGPERIVWGSDWPQHRECDPDTHERPTYAAQVALVQSWIAPLGDDVMAAIGGKNAAQLWPGPWNQPPEAHQ